MAESIFTLGTLRPEPRLVSWPQDYNVPEEGLSWTFIRPLKEIMYDKTNIADLRLIMIAILIKQMLLIIGYVSFERCFRTILSGVLKIAADIQLF